MHLSQPKMHKLTAMRNIQTTPIQISQLVNSYLHFLPLSLSLSRLIVFNSTRSNASHRIDDQHIQHTKKSTQHNIYAMEPST